jgi:hypothetical protein
MVLVKKLDSTANPGRTGGLNGHPFKCGKRRMDDSDRLQFNHFLLPQISDDKHLGIRDRYLIQVARQIQELVQIYSKGNLW